MAERPRPKESLLELHEDEALATEHLDSQVREAQEQLLQLKYQQEVIEKQKRELEELSRRQEQLHQGKAEMTDKFTRALVVLEREIYDAEKQVELLKVIQESFLQHSSVLESINPKNWGNMDINKELTKSLSAVDDARSEYLRARSKINLESSDETLDPSIANGDPYQVAYSAGPNKDFVYWLKSGFAFTLPLLILGLIILIVLLLHFPI